MSTTTTAARRGRPQAPNVAEQHAEWLSLLRADGPFLALPVLTAVLPSGLDTVAQPVRERVRQAWGEFEDDPGVLGSQWQDFVLAELLRLPPSVVRDTALEEGLSFPGTPPDQVVYGPGADGAREVRLHVYRRPVDTPLTAATRQTPSLSERAAQVCRDTGVPLALLTDGRYWVLVHARTGGPTSTAVFDADLWQEEPILLRAFATLLSVTRVLQAAVLPDGAHSASLAALFARTEDAQADITGTLGGQVRQAVELLVSELARIDREAGGALLRDVDERDIYRGSLTTLMRLVFLLYAEERRLLPVNDAVYSRSYAVTTLFEQLTDARDRYGDEIGDRRKAAWPRLLATFAAIHGGCEHPDLTIPAHGGSLFDPTRHTWLTRADVSDRVVHEVLDALLVLRHRTKAAERLSYQSLGVEDIGHIYEGLLEFSCLKVAEPYVGLIGKHEPELSLARLEAGVNFTEVCGLTAKQLEKALAATPTPVQIAALHAACDNDSDLADRIKPFWGLLRQDLRTEPTVYPAGSVLFTQVGDRRSTGTHYTPRKLAEEVVEHTLAPLCYIREQEGVSRLRKSEELLALKVCDPTMGSGAFLVAACRYLADRLVEAWEREGVPVDVVGGTEDIQLTALRRVASKCIYGVDRDDMAVDLAKLSMWLVTLAKNKPFGFLDHALRCGDSLIGVLTERQVERFHLDPDGAGMASGGWTFGFAEDFIGPVLSEVAELRESIKDRPDNDLRQIEEKAALLAQADALSRRLRIAGDAVVGAALSTVGQSNDRYKDRLAGVSEETTDLLRERADDSPLERALCKTIAGWLTGTRDKAIRPFHWALEFPEVMRGGGFDAVVGNPPFIGGKRVSGAIGVDVREYLKTRIANDKPGNADLCSYFLLRDLHIAQQGRVGIIATNTIAQGDTREVGLDQAVDNGWQVYRAEKSQPWPGTASLEVSLLWVGHTGEGEVFYLDGNQVQAITPSLDPRSRVSGNPYRLEASSGQAFQGALVLGGGFVLEPHQAEELIERDPRNRDVLFPFLNGEELNSRPDCSAARWVINFHEWPISRAKEYSEVFSIIEDKVKPEREKKDPRTYAGLMDRWWLFWRTRSELNRSISKLDRVLTITLHTKFGMPLWVTTGQVFSHGLGVFATDRDAYLTLLSSNVHFAWWTTKGESTMRTDARYTPSDGFETFPQPELTARMDQIGEQLHTFRRSVMLEKQLGLTKLYNLVHNESETGEDVQRIRELHTEVDLAVAEAYGWADLDLGHGFHDIRQGRRFTIKPSVQTEILDRLLELNHERYAEEVAKGLHNKGKRKPAHQAKHQIDTSEPAPDGMLL